MNTCISLKNVKSGKTYYVCDPEYSWMNKRSVSETRCRVRQAEDKKKEQAEKKKEKARKTLRCRGYERVPYGSTYEHVEARREEAWMKGDPAIKGSLTIITLNQFVRGDRPALKDQISDIKRLVSNNSGGGLQ